MTRGRSSNRRGIKQHRSYTVDEAARSLGVAKGTVRRWLKSGLPALADRKPMLILGSDLAEFLANRKPKRQRCAIHECFCFTCRATRPMAERMAEIVSVSATSGNVRALCATCLGVMHKRVSLAQLPAMRSALDLSFSQAVPPIPVCVDPCPNDHLT